MADQGLSLNDILSQYALKETDLSIKCPREVSNEIAVKLIDWKMIGYSLGFPAEKLTSIGRENETQDLCKVALLDSWSKREGEEASYMKLADALYRRQRRDLVEFLCKLLIASQRGATAEIGKCRQTTSSSTGLKINDNLLLTLINSIGGGGGGTPRIESTISWLDVRTVALYDINFIWAY